MAIETDERTRQDRPGDARRNQRRPEGEARDENRPVPMDEEEFHRVEERAAELQHKLSTGGPFGRLVEDVRLLGEMSQDIIGRRYRQFPWWAIGAIAGTLIYFVNPFDIVPDFLPVLGYLDDATVFAVGLLLVEQQLHAYRDWRDGPSRGPGARRDEGRGAMGEIRGGRVEPHEGL